MGKIKRFYRNLVGTRYGKLTVVEEVEPIRSKQHRYRCLCDCGNYTYADSSTLTGGYKVSCGCIKRGVGALNLRSNVIKAEREYRERRDAEINEKKRGKELMKAAERLKKQAKVIERSKRYLPTVAEIDEAIKHADDMKARAESERQKKIESIDELRSAKYRRNDVSTHGQSRPYIPEDMSFLNYPNDEWMFMPEKWGTEFTTRRGSKNYTHKKTD